MKVLYEVNKERLIATLLGLIACLVVFSQSAVEDEKLNKAIKYFEQESYQKVVPIVEDIMKKYPNKAATNYYLGASYMKLDIKLDESIQLLKYSCSKNYRTDAHFYLFQAYLKKHQFSEAEISLINYTNLAKRKEQKKMQTGYWFEELATAREMAKHIPLVDTLSLNSSESEEKQKGDTDLQITASKEISHHSEYDVLLQKALLLQLTCDSLKSELTIKLVELKAESIEDERRKLHSEVAIIKRQLNILQPKADGLFNEAEMIRSGEKDEIIIEIIEEYPVKENEYVYLDKEIGDIRLYAFHSKGILPSEEEETEKPTIRSLEFNIFSQSPYSKDNPIPVNTELPDGLVYQIQLGVYSQELPQDAFGGLYPISASTIKDKNLTKYFVGIFFSSLETKKALQQVKEYGYPDAFLVPYFNQGKISVQSAREIEFGEKKLNK